MMLLSVREFDAFIKSLEYKEIIFFHENQDCVRQPLYYDIAFNKMLVSATTNTVCFSRCEECGSSFGKLWIENIDKICIDDTSMLGLIAIIECHDTNKSYKYSFVIR